jgi:hypothetical protein
MSHSIIYRKLFVKFPNNTYLPFVEYGDSNVYDALPSGKSGRRSRDWGLCGTVFLPTQNVPATEHEMLANLDRIHGQQIQRAETYNKDNDSPWEYNGEEFGSWMGLKIGSKYASLKQFKNFVKNGCKNAVLFENLESNGISVVIKSSMFLRTDHPTMEHFFLHVIADNYLSVLKEKTDYLSATNFNPIVELSANSVSIDRLLEKKKVRRAKKDPNTYDEKWAVKFQDGYFTKMTSRSMRYNGNQAYAKIFPSKKIADKTADKLAIKWPDYDFNAIKL